MFVGQAPGEQEDDEGKCFVGPAGQLLMQAIQEYQIKPCRLSNIVKCYPPGDRRPSKEEVMACRGYLGREIAHYRPEYIVALGGVALNALTGKDNILDYSGTVAGEIGGSKVFALLHPSFILRQPHNLQKFEMHLKGLKAILDGTTEAAVKVEHFSVQQADEFLRSADHDRITFDYETNGKPWYAGGKVRLVNFHASGKTFVVIPEGPEGAKMMRAFLTSKPPKAAHNSIFDYTWSVSSFGEAPVNLVLDTLLMHYAIDENSAHDLESVAGEYLGVPRWDISPEMVDNGWDYETVPLEKLIPYGGKDAFYTHELVGPLAIKMKDEGVTDLYQKLLIPLAHLCARLSLRGIRIDKAWCAKIDSIYGDEMGDLARKLTSMDVVKNYTKAQLLKNKKFVFNPGSDHQVRDIVYGKLKFKTDIETKGGRPSTAEKVLKQFAGKHEFIDTLLAWTKKYTLRNNYLEKFPLYCDGQDRIHASFTPTIQVTGRLSASEPPAHGIPREPDVRGMVVSRFPKGKILANDFKALEMRLLASEANEEKLIEIFQKGLDPHDMTAIDMFGRGFTKAQRDIAKRMNFGTVYGITEYGIAREFQATVEQALRWIERHQRTYPSIYRWMREQQNFIKKNGYITSRFGRKRRLPEAMDPELNEWKLKRIFRQTGNFPIQSQGADINNLSAVLLDKELRQQDLVSVIIHCIHDSILVDVAPGEDDEVKGLCKYVMEDLMMERCPWLKVKLKVDQDFYDRWGVK
jgi:DNA polymerase-1